MPRPTRPRAMPPKPNFLGPIPIRVWFFRSSLLFRSKAADPDIQLYAPKPVKAAAPARLHISAYDTDHDESVDERTCQSAAETVVDLIFL